MIKMTAEKFKDSLLKGVYFFNEPITIIDKLDFSRKIDKKIKALPENLFVTELDLLGSKIRSLPKTISIGTLDLRGSKLTTLTKNLSVQVLDLYKSQIKDIPATLQNVEIIYVDTTFLPTISDSSFLTCVNLFKNIITESAIEGFEFVKEQFEDRLQKGKIDSRHYSPYKIKELPDNLSKELFLFMSPIK